ncbi:MAG: hypothetical protein HKN43_04435 [Rhodothermales bacterium]|nr:hypothetical protein [Rhodothermales bacterium]
MRQPQFFALLLLSSLAVASASAQAWTQPAGNAYLKVAHGRTAVHEQFDLDGNVIPFIEGVAGDTFLDRSVYLYGEFGVIPGFTFVAMVPIKNLTVIVDEGIEQATVGIADIEVRGRLDLRPLLGATGGALASAFSVGARLPTGYTRNLSPSVGSGQLDLHMSLSLGRSFHPVPVYAQASAGFENRSRVFGLSRTIDCTGSNDIPCIPADEPDFDNEWLYSAEVGVSAGSRILIQFLLNGIRSVNAPEELFDVTNPIPTRRRFTKLGSGVTVAVGKGVGASLQIFRTASGRNTIRATEYFFGLEYKITR